LVLLEVGAGGLRAANVRGPASRPLILMYCPNRQLCHINTVAMCYSKTHYVVCLAGFCGRR